MFRRVFGPAAAVGLAITAGSASALTLNLDSVVGTFKDPVWETLVLENNTWVPKYDVPADVFVRFDDGTVDPNEIRWGDSRATDNVYPHTVQNRPVWIDVWGEKQSGYTFDNLFNESFTDVDPGEIIDFGNFLVENGVLWGNSAVLTSVTLQVEIEGTVEKDVGGGVMESDAFSLVVDLFLGHNETINDPNFQYANNVPPCPAADPDGTECGDTLGGLVSIVENDPAIIGGMAHFLTIQGIVSKDAPDLGDPIFGFFTDEREENLGELRATLVVQVIPLPAGVWLMLAGMGGLAVAARRRKRD